ncbi:DNA protection during starvation protein [Streptomyces sp. YIM 130001]|uniref:Dps family protein n=1 Tax=Streptomyces sp. YIM 130001 TaxID=2259644 RepID=UPI000EEFCDC3|nr:DNA starvation/stationary phase protection protein [Streptomyces sp. YIM 130001]RII17899.1 DNA protection during starvation protein [Streptomyces sp. YIM 130001]
MQDAGTVIELLQQRLHALNDLNLTLKHIHWNVVGPHFIAVHEMLDPQVDRVRDMADDVAERVAALGGVAQGTPGALIEERTWKEYSVGIVYTGVLEALRSTIKTVGDIDAATEDLLIEQLRDLEPFQWSVRTHLETAGGTLTTSDATTEVEAARQSSQQ